MIRIQFLVDSWRKIGLDVEVAPSTYNQFQEKVKKNRHQIYMWGWIADYPDPENFLFLLTSKMAEGDGPNHSNFKNQRFDALFEQMRSRENDAIRAKVIAEMIGLLEFERPWIELFHGESYALYHGWVEQYKRPGFVYPTIKYQNINADLRSASRTEWNQAVIWPAFALAFIALAIVIPGIRTLIRERQ